MKTIVKIFFIIISLTITNVLQLAAQTSVYESVEELAAKNKVRINLTATGSHYHNIVKANITNTTNDTLRLKFDGGRILEAKDDAFYDVLITQETKVDLQPKQEKEVKLVGYYCEKGKQNPKLGERYAFGRIAPNEWIAFAEYLTHSDSVPYKSVQQAVDVLSQNLSIGTIYPDNENGVKEMKRRLSEITQESYPWYYISSYKDVPIKLWGTLHFSVNDTSAVTVQIKNADGELVKKPIENKIYYPGYNYYEVDLKLNTWEKGEYVVEVIVDATKLRVRKRFEL